MDDITKLAKQAEAAIQLLAQQRNAALDALVQQTAVLASTRAELEECKKALSEAKGEGKDGSS